MKATINKLYRDDKISVWGEAYDNRGKVYIEIDAKSAKYIRGAYSNVVLMKSACEYAPEINKWWVALA